MKHLLFFLLSALFVTACFSSRSTTSAKPSKLTPRDAEAVTATGNAQTDYVERFKDAAVAEMQRAGIPASITLAQGILESAAGQSELATTANNHFGIKCGNNWSGKAYHKKDDDRDPDGNLIESCFRKYGNPEESFFDHSEFLRDPRKSNRYGFLFNLDKRDYKNWARGLQSAGYATATTYSDQLIDLIERLRLYEFDQPGATAVKPGGVIPATVPPQSRIGRVNNVKAVNSREGENLADVARIYRLNPEKVADYNDRAYAPGESIPTGTRIFIESKRDSWHGQATHHFVKEKQTVMEISQLYGIKMEKLLERNGLAAGQEPASNEKIRLRGKRGAGEHIRLRPSEGDNADPVPATPVATTPGSMTADDNVLFEISRDSVKTAQAGASTGSIPGKPATTGVPYPPDPVPATSTPSSTFPTTSPSIPQPNPVTTAPAATGPYHTVVKGDTLFSVSRKYGISVARIKQLNNLPDDNIKIGQLLRVQ